MEIAEWRKELKTAIDADTVDTDKLKAHSADWCNCAVGARLMDAYGYDEIQPHTGEDIYIEDQLTDTGKHLGVEFHRAISAERYNRALAIFNEIQASKLDAIVMDCEKDETAENLFSAYAFGEPPE